MNNTEAKFDSNRNLVIPCRHNWQNISSIICGFFWVLPLIYIMGRLQGEMPFELNIVYVIISAVIAVTLFYMGAILRSFYIIDTLKQKIYLKIQYPWKDHIKEVCLFSDIMELGIDCRFHSTKSGSLYLYRPVMLCRNGKKINIGWPEKNEFRKSGELLVEIAKLIDKPLVKFQEKMQLNPVRKGENWKLSYTDQPVIEEGIYLTLAISGVIFIVIGLTVYSFMN